MEFTLARNHAGKLASSQSITRTEGAGLANQGTARNMQTHKTTPMMSVIEIVAVAAMAV
jgi:ABC-type branched-subunit amino acid transport system ATPase component